MAQALSSVAGHLQSMKETSPVLGICQPPALMPGVWWSCFCHSLKIPCYRRKRLRHVHFTKVGHQFWKASPSFSLAPTSLKNQRWTPPKHQQFSWRFKGSIRIHWSKRELLLLAENATRCWCAKYIVHTKSYKITVIFCKAVNEEILFNDISTNSFCTSGNYNLSRYCGNRE